MTNQDQDLTKLRIRVAELCLIKRDRWMFSLFPDNQPIINCDGYTSQLEAKREHNKLKKEGVAVSKIEKYKLPVKDLPDYPNDLNACRELIDLLAKKGWIVIIHNDGGKWNVAFYKQGIREDYEAVDDNLAVAICCAFVSLQEAPVAVGQ